ncbi:PTS glucose transporter subunit IIA [Clostridium intestinale]|uniref:PTS glucose transporter subunit IIA n=1 Tax=Clostridium intestinale TaxID=36845 RepID=A0A7D6ZXK3_9CLOT|nr:PTS glucose transporter subunit IIA [Clostridium intestinale]
MFKNLFKKKNENLLYAFCDGESLDLSKVNDEVFSQKMMGDGIAIKPSNTKVYAPCESEIVTIMMESKHAVGLRTKEGIELLIHVGIDTVNLKGEGFSIHCKENQQVKKGDLLLSFDREVLKRENLDDTIMLILAEPNGHEIKKYHVGETMKASESILLEIK